MGCDIHGPWIEVQHTWTDHDGKVHADWLAVAEVFEAQHRNYDMFEKLAGVRGDENHAVVPPRGYPPDMGHNWEDHVFPMWADGVTEMRKRRRRYREGDISACYEYTDCHSASWLNVNEVDEALEKYHVATGEHNDGWTLVSMIMRFYEMRGQEVRVGFCFDN